ncbi:hypothetical protein APY03_2380 [Variovorax sp. WDL1]|nr:hypothetical protein APY03_2380 [Variovorax sp. WDL1]
MQCISVDTPGEALLVGLDQDVDAYVKAVPKEVGERAEERQHLYASGLQDLAAGK